MERSACPVEFVGGRRVTTPAGADVVRASLAAVNESLCAAIGPRAVGLLGDEIGLRGDAGAGARPRRRPAPVPAAPRSRRRSRTGCIPVVAPLAAGPLNVNADEAAAALAVGLGAERHPLRHRRARAAAAGAVVPSIDADEADRLLDEGALDGGIVPKLRAAVTAARLGVRAEIGETAVVA